MTTQTQGFTAQGLSAYPGQEGMTGNGFPAPIGTEQFFGAVQGYGNQVPYGFQHPGNQFQHSSNQHWQHAQWQAAQQVAQIVAVAQQIIVPQAAALAVQQAYQQLPQVVAQLTTHINGGNLAGRYGAQQDFGQQIPGYFSGQQGTQPWGQQPWGNQPWAQQPMMAGTPGQPGRTYPFPS